MAVEIPDEVKSLSPALLAQLEGIEPSVTEMGLKLYPCEVELDDGTFWPRVYVVEAGAYIAEWGVWPWKDPGKSWIAAQRIHTLRESRERLPLRFAAELNKAGESGMGYCCFSLVLKDRRRLYFVTGNAFDFPNWPPGVRPADVVRVNPGDRHPEHKSRSPRDDESCAAFAWSPYRES